MVRDGGALTLGSHAVLEFAAGNGDGLYGGYVMTGRTPGMGGTR